MRRSIFDVRRAEAYAGSAHVLPTARWREHTLADDWSRSLRPDADIVVYCVHGHQVSQLRLPRCAKRAPERAVLKGGFDAWRSSGAPVIAKAALPGRDELVPSRWVTRVHPKIDRIACPWLIRRFIDREAKFYFVEPSQVVSAAKEFGGIPYDVEGVEFTHDGPLCSFDTIIKRFGLSDPLLDSLSLIVRGADTGRPDLAREAAGLLAVSLGISALSATTTPAHSIVAFRSTMRSMRGFDTPRAKCTVGHPSGADFRCSRTL